MMIDLIVILIEAENKKVQLIKGTNKLKIQLILIINYLIIN